MLYELFETEIPPLAAAVILGAVLGLLFGAAAQISRFCLRRSVVAGPDRGEARGVWAFALFTTLLATQLLAIAGWIDLADHRFAAPGLPVAAVLLGGLLFGAGMVLTRGCISRLTVLTGSGNLRAALVILVFAITAHAMLKGVLAPLRVAIGSVTVEAGDAALLSGLPGGAPVWTALLAIGLLALVAGSRARPAHLALAAVIGALVPLGWFGTGAFLMDDFDPIPLETVSFTAPWADTLFWSIAATSIPAGFGTGLVGGVLAGAFLAAAARGKLKLESFETPVQTLRYVAGGALMGAGGVLAGGCTVGAGLSGVSALSVAAILALLAMVAGALLTDRLLDGRRPLRAAITPAE